VARPCCRRAGAGQHSPTCKQQHFPTRAWSDQSNYADSDCTTNLRPGLQSRGADGARAAASRHIDCLRAWNHTQIAACRLKSHRFCPGDRQGNYVNTTVILGISRQGNSSQVPMWLANGLPHPNHANRCKQNMEVWTYLHICPPMSRRVVA
jgi:hypothetical protein